MLPPVNQQFMQFGWSKGGYRVEKLLKRIEYLEETVSKLSQVIFLNSDNNALISNKAIGMTKDNENNVCDTQDAICESSTYIEKRLTDIENALCELSESEV